MGGARDGPGAGVTYSLTPSSDLLALIREGADELDRGEGIPHETVLGQLDAMIAKHDARQRSVLS